MMKKIILSSLLVRSFLYTKAQVGINNNDPKAILDVKGDLRIRDINDEENTGVYPALVIEQNGFIKKEITDIKGVYRAHLSESYFTGRECGKIYKIEKLSTIDNPYQEFDEINKLYTAPETGLYELTMTITVNAVETSDFIKDLNYVIGLADNDTKKWVIRYSIPNTSLPISIDPNGVTHTFKGTVNLEKGKKYYFGVTLNINLLANPGEANAKGIGSTFELLLIKKK